MSILRKQILKSLRQTSATKRLACCVTNYLKFFRSNSQRGSICKTNSFLKSNKQFSRSPSHLMYQEARDKRQFRRLRLRKSNQLFNLATGLDSHNSTFSQPKNEFV